MIREARGEEQRNNSIDVLKLICALLVIFIHCHYPYKRAILPVTDVAVPIFFCISGYFVFGSKRKWARIFRIGNIFLASILLYLAKVEIFRLMNGSILWLPSFRNIFNLIIFNEVSISLHLWYLSAYLYVLIFAFLLDKYNLWKQAFYTIVPLLIIQSFIKYAISDYCPHNPYYYRNAYFLGLPYFLVGALIKDIRGSHLQKYLQKWNNRLSSIIIPIIVLLFVFRYLVTGNDFVIIVAREFDCLLLTISIFVFSLLVRQPNENLLSRLGRKYTLYIYVLHLFIFSIVEMLIDNCPLIVQNVYSYFSPIIIFLVSVVATYILGKLKLIRL